MRGHIPASSTLASAAPTRRPSLLRIPESGQDCAVQGEQTRKVAIAQGGVPRASATPGWQRVQPVALAPSSSSVTSASFEQRPFQTLKNISAQHSGLVSSSILDCRQAYHFEKLHEKEEAAGGSGWDARKKKKAEFRQRASMTIGNLKGNSPASPRTNNNAHATIGIVMWQSATAPALVTTSRPGNPRRAATSRSGVRRTHPDSAVSLR
jgi:hypothetical protein